MAPIFRMVCSPVALAGGPKGWTAETLRDGEVALVVDDVRTEKKNRMVNEPVVFYTHGLHQADEFVVNSVSKDKISGYISVPKNQTSAAALGH